MLDAGAPKSVVVIGNAPTALFYLLEMLDAGAPKPALILGFPVGFVGAAESKDMLAADSRGVPYVIVRGRRGGSAMAARLRNRSSTAKAAIAPTIRRVAVALSGNREQFQTMPDQPISQPGRDLFLQRLDVGIDEFDHIARDHVDQVVMVVAFGVFIARAPVAEFQPFQNTGLFQQLDRAVNRGQRNARINGGGAGVQLFDIGVIFGRTDDARQHAALVCHAQALGLAAGDDDQTDLSRAGIPARPVILVRASAPRLRGRCGVPSFRRCRK
eukprot:gene48803-59759_t